MPEHVHLLMSETETGFLALALQIVKQMVSRPLRGSRTREPFWQARYYDFNVWSDRKRIEKLRYMHRNPVKGGLVQSPQEWSWSSFRHYLTGKEGTVEVESAWTARERERAGVFSQGVSKILSRRPSLRTERGRLGHPAILIVPCPRATMPAYAHLAAFVRTTPVDQQHALWKVVGEAMERRHGAKPVWLSTAGAGVAWLHVRLDDRPRYYRHRPYRKEPRATLWKPSLPAPRTTRD